MKRDEEIKQAAAAYISEMNKDSDVAEGFRDGAKWADKTMIDRACEWLKENIDLYSYNAFNTKSCYTEIKLTDVFETAFRQAMDKRCYPKYS